EKSAPDQSIFGSTPTWWVQNKIDLFGKGNNEEINNNSLYKRFTISCVTGHGIYELVNEMGRYARTFFGAEPALITREMHRKLLEDAMSALDRALLEDQEEILAEELRSASASLGRLLGRVDVEDVLDTIFRNFCIGK